MDSVVNEKDNKSIILNREAPTSGPLLASR